MTIEEFNALPQAQRKAMRKLQYRSGIPWLAFLEQAQAPGGIFPYVGIPDFHGMFVGIEPDGYTHS